MTLRNSAAAPRSASAAAPSAGRGVGASQAGPVGRQAGLARGDLAEVVKVFERFDRDGNNCISKLELGCVLKRLDPIMWTDASIRTLFIAADMNHDGVIDYKEFLAWLQNRASPGQRNSVLSIATNGQHARTPNQGHRAEAGVRASALDRGRDRGGARGSSLAGAGARAVSMQGSSGMGSPSGAVMSSRQGVAHAPSSSAQSASGDRHATGGGRSKRPADVVSVTSVEGSGCAQLVDDSFDWLRKGNNEQERESRRAIARQTQAVCDGGFYILDGRRIALGHVRSMLDGTRFVRASDAQCEADTSSPNISVQWFQHAPGSLAKVACDETFAGKRICLVNAASAYHCCGGFESGGRHALEESLCVQTTLSLSLHKATKEAKLQGVKVPACAEPPRPLHGTWHCHIPEDGVVLSPNVEVFRDGTAAGYPFMPRIALLAAVVSVAMPNANAKMRDAPVDMPSSGDAYMELLGQKFAALLHAVKLSRAEVLVVPDMGCGVYENDPSVVGRALGAAIFIDQGHLKEIHLVGSAQFCRMAESTGQGYTAEEDCFSA